MRTITIEYDETQAINRPEEIKELFNEYITNNTTTSLRLTTDENMRTVNLNGVDICDVLMVELESSSFNNGLHIYLHNDGDIVGHMYVSEDDFCKQWIDCDINYTKISYTELSD